MTLLLGQKILYLLDAFLKRLEIKKLQCNINKEIENVSALLSGKADTYLTSVKMLPLNQRPMLQTAFEIWTKTIEDQRK